MAKKIQMKTSSKASSKQDEKKPDEPKEEKKVSVKTGPKTESFQEEKDPAIAALIAIGGGLLLGFPGGGYIYLDNIKRGLIYGGINWVLWGLIIIGYFAASIITMGLGGFVCLPVFILPLLYVALVTYDTYLYAKGEKPILPEI